MTKCVYYEPKYYNLYSFTFIVIFDQIYFIYNYKILNYLKSHHSKYHSIHQKPIRTDYSSNKILFQEFDIMQKDDQLTDNGIQKLINNIPTILQIVDLSTKQKGATKFYIAQLSDGYAKVKKCVIMIDQTKNQKPKKYDVISIEQSKTTMKDDKPLHICVQRHFNLRSDLKDIIGQPIYWNDYERTRHNPKGDNRIPPKNAINNQEKKNNAPTNLYYLFDDQDQIQNNNTNTQSNVLLKKPQQNTAKNNQISNNNFNKGSSNQKQRRGLSSDSQHTQSIPTSNFPKKVNNNLQDNNKSNNNGLNNKGNMNNQNNQNNLMKNQNNQSKNQNKQQSGNSRHERDYTFIKELYDGIQNFKLKVRVLFVNPLKNYIKKTNGQQSHVFSFQACDKFETIQFSAFGQPAVNFNNVVEIDNIFQISGGKVSKDDRNGGKLKIMLTQRSNLNLLQQDPTLPQVDDHCITPEKLLEKDVGTQWNIVALVKDANEIIQFTSRNGNLCKKKQIFLCDPLAKVEIPVTLWFDKVNLKFDKTPYALQGIVVGSYRQQKQYSTSNRFNCRPCKTHQFKKFINTYEDMKLQNPVHDFSGNKNKFELKVFNFQSLRLEAQSLQLNNSITIEKVCYLSQISLTGKNTYLSCPACKKKVIDQYNGVCPSDKCGKPYLKGKYRYLLNVAIADQTETIWAIAYDQAAQVLLTIRKKDQNEILYADEFAKISQEQLKLKIPAFLYQQYKMSITAKKDSYNGMDKIKYSINKAIFNFDYHNQISTLSKQIQFLLKQRKE